MPNEFDAAAQEMAGEGQAPVANEFDEVARQIAARNDVLLRSSTLDGFKADPDRRAKVLALSKATQLSPELVERNFDNISRQARLTDQDRREIQEDHPQLAQWLSDRDNAAVAQDDLVTLRRLDWALRSAAAPADDPTGLLPPGWNFGLSSGQGKIIERLPGGLGNVYHSFDEVADELRQRGESFEIRRDMARDVAGEGLLASFGTGILSRLAISREAREAGEERLEASSLTTPGLAGDIARAAGGLAGDLPLLFLGGPIGRYAKTLVGSVRVQKVLQQLPKAEVFKRRVEAAAEVAGAVQPLAIRSGIETAEEEGAVAGLTTAMIETLIPSAFGRTGIERIVTSGIGRSLGPQGWLPYVRRWATEFGLEGVEENLTEYAHAIHEVVSGINPQALEDEQLQRRLAVATIVGPFGSAFLTAPSFIAERLHQNTLAADQIARQAAEVRLAAAAVRESATGKRSPDRLEALTKLIAGQNEQAAKVYFQTEDWDAYWQQQGQNPANVARDVLGGDPAAYALAKASGGQFAIPIESYLGRIASNEQHLAGLEGAARYRADGFSLDEAKQFGQALPQQLERIAAEAGAAEATAVIREDVLEQLSALGQDVQSARETAQLVESGIRTLAQRAGIDPVAFYDRYGLRFERELPEALRQPEAISQLEAALPALVEKLQTGAVADDPIATALRDYLASTGLDDLTGISPEAIRNLIRQEVARQRPAAAPAAEGQAAQTLEQEPARQPLSEAGQAFVDSLSAEDRALIQDSIDYLQRVPDPGGDLGNLQMALQIARRRQDKLRQKATELYQPANVAVVPRSGSLRRGELVRQWRKAFGDRALPDRERDSWAALVDQAAEIDRQRGVVVNLEQEKRGKISFGADRRFTITLLAKADRSTVLHELGHFYLEILGDLAAGEGAPAQIRQDYQTILSWFGVERRDQITTDHHETFARGFEAFLFEGKAPSKELRGAFERFVDWLAQVYRDLKALRVRLTDDVRGVFDRILATDEEIERAKAELNRAAVFTSPEQASMKPEEFQAYLAAVEDAEQRGEAALRQRVLAQLERQRKREWKDERAKVRAEVAAEIDQRREYRVAAYLQKGTQPDGSPLAADVAPAKLSREQLLEQFGAEVVAKLPRGVMAAQGGASPHAVADLFGFATAGEMVLALANAPNRTALIEAETDARMRERHGDLLLDGNLPEQARQAVHSEERAKVLQREIDHMAARSPELRRLARRMGARADAGIQVRSEARRYIAGRQIRDVVPLVYYRAEAKAARDAYAAVAKGDYITAIEKKQQELFNHELYRAAVDAVEAVDEAVAYAKRFNRSAVRERIAKVPGDYLEQIDAILDQYEFRRVALTRLDERKRLSDLIAKLDAEGQPHSIPPAVAADAEVRNYRTLTVNQLSAVVDAVRSIEHLAKHEGKLLLEQKRLEEAEIVAEVTDSVIANAKPGAGKPPRLRTTIEAIQDFGRSALSVFLNVDTLAREIDGGKELGPVYRHTKSIIDDAQSRLWLPRSKQAYDELAALYEVYTQRELRAMHSKRSAIFIPAINQALTKEQRLAIALNWGNQQNREALKAGERIQSGENWDDAAVGAILNTLDERDWRFVQSVWDYVDTYWPEIEAAEKRRTGVAPEKVEATPVVTRFGVFRGGYYPLRYDRRRSIMVSEEEASEAAKRMRAGRFAKAQTRRGHIIERTNSGGRPVVLGFEVLHAHVHQVVYDLTMGDAVTYVDRVLNNRSTKDAFERSGNIHAWDALDVWIKDVAAGEIVGTGAVETTLRHLRGGMTVSLLGWNLNTFLLQPLGFAQSLVAIGPRYLWSGLRAMLTRPWRGDQGVFAQTYALSPFMRDRATTFNKDVWDAMQALRGGIFPDIVLKSFFWHIAKAQQLVDIVTWLGAYEKGKAELGDDARAAQLADIQVRRSQASGLFADRSAIERGTINRNIRQTEMVRVWTALSSYVIAKANLAYQRTRDTNFRNPVQIMRWASDMVLLFTVEALVMAVIRGEWPDEDDEKADSVPAFAVKESLKTAFGSMPFIREAVSAIEGFQGGGVVGFTSDRIGRAATQILQLFDETKEDQVDLPLLKSLNNLGGLFFHYPSNQMNRFLDAAWRDSEGEDVAPVEYFLYQKREKP